MKTGLILITIFAFAFGHDSINWRCAFNEKKFKMDVIEPNVHPSSLKEKITVPFEIYYDYTKIETQIGSVSYEYISHIKTVLDEAKRIFKKIINGRKNEGKLKFSECSDLPVSDVVKNQGVDANIVLFPFFDDTLPDGALASAAPCIVGYWPIAGLIGINPKYSNYKRPNAFYYTLSMLMHEFTHIFVFNPDLFQYYRDENFDLRKIVLKEKIVNEVKRSFIATPKVIETAKKHFRCSDIEGVELEDQGGSGTAGTHWEARVMFTDYMIGSINDESVISEITLALFEDSGWYTVNYYTGGLFRFGKHEGCKFLNEKCIQEEKTAFKRAFCDKSNVPFCSNGRSTKGLCLLKEQMGIPLQYQYFSNPNLGGNIFANFCPISYTESSDDNIRAWNCKLGNVKDESLGEVMSSSSLCFISSLSPNSLIYRDEKAICYPYECNFQTNTTIVTVLQTSIVCPHNGTVIKVEGFSGYIKCPVFTDVCTTLKACSDIIDCIDKESLPIMDSDIIIPDQSIQVMLNRILIAISLIIFIS